MGSDSERSETSDPSQRSPLSSCEAASRDVKFAVCLRRGSHSSSLERARTHPPAHNVTVLVISHERYVPGHVTQGGCTPDKGNSRTEITGGAAFFMVLSFYFLFCVAAFFEESGGPCSEPLSEEAGPPNSLPGNAASSPHPCQRSSMLFPQSARSAFTLMICNYSMS